MNLMIKIDKKNMQKISSNIQFKREFLHANL